MTAAGGMLLAGVLLYSACFMPVSRVGVGSLVLALLALGLCLAGELLGRYLFFVTVVPKNMAGAFFR